MSSATVFSLVAHLVALAVLFTIETSTINDSRILDAVESRFVSVAPIELPPPVEVAEYIEPEPEPEPEPVVEPEPEFEPVPTTEEIEVEEPVRVARDEEPEPEIVEPVEDPAPVVAVNVIPAAEPVVTTTEASAPAAVRSDTVAAASPTSVAEPQEVTPIVEPERVAEVDGEQVRRARARYERQVHSRLSQLGDAPRRILQSAGTDGPFEVELVAVVDERGRILELRLVQSSGVPALDEFAQASVERLRRLVRVPAELGVDARQVPISLVYEA